MKKSLSVNAFLNTLRSILNMIFPLITFPYVSRVLGATGIGKYNFSNSVVSYFLMIAALGINTYAIREGAKYRDSRTKISNFASEIFSINIVSTVISYVLLLIFVVLFPQLTPYWKCICIFSIQIIFTTLGVEWIYSIFEEYAYITCRSIFFKLLSILLLFVFVRNKNDYLNYAAVTVFATVGSNILNFVHLGKLCSLKFTFRMNLREHLKPILIIFASSIAISVYVNSDITVLGILKNDKIVGIYSVAVKIYNILKTLLSAALIVTIPRLAMLYGQKRWREHLKVARNILNLLILLTFPAVVGLFMVSEEVIEVLSGPEYIDATVSLQLLSVAAIFSIFAWFYSDCILIPAKREKIVLYSTIFSAIVNLLLNIVLIPKYNQNAAAFSTIIAELANMIVCVYVGTKIVKIDRVLKNFTSVLVATCSIILVCLIVRLLVRHLILRLILSIVLSAISYLIVLIILKNSLVVNFIREKFNVGVN